MTDEQIRIGREELFDPEVDKALARERVGRERIVSDTAPTSPVRRLLLNSMFYLPVAAVLGALVSWWLLEPHFNDRPVIRGEISLVNAEPFDAAPGLLLVTVGTQEVLVDPAHVAFEPGAHGEPALASADELKVGARIEAAGLATRARLIATTIRPTKDPEPHGTTEEAWWPDFLLFLLTSALVAFGLLLSEGITTRNWARMIVRTLLGTLLAGVFSLLARFPATVFLLFSHWVFQKDVEMHRDLFVVTIKDIGLVTFFVQVACRSAAWACIGAATGLGMNLVWSARSQLRNSVIGGALGGALGGLFFDPIDRFFVNSQFAGAGVSRCVGLIAVGLSIGIFVALVERLARDAWLRVRTGPLAGKSFILYKTPSIIGNAPQSDVYLYKDAEIDPSHAAIHRVGVAYEIEDLGTRMGTSVGGNKIRRRRLVSGDQIVIGSTILDFEERQKRTPVA